MAYFAEVRTVILYIENHVKDEKFDMDELSRAVGFSIAHVRDIFQRKTGIALKKYVTMRKVYNSAFDLLHSKASVLEIALSYGFDSHETYTRAFKRIVKITPKEFRRIRPQTAKEMLASGVYGISVQGDVQKGWIQMQEREMLKKDKSTILFGVPMVGYGEYGFTPFPICLKACSNYLGEDIDYEFSMVSSGAAFRFTWNRTEWDLSNVDIYHSFDENNEVYGVGAKALGREFSILVRTKETKKEDFQQFIKSHIDQGFPCIALGIVGPPEAGIITGYEEDGDVLLGWSFFQHDPDFGAFVEFAENGYYKCRTWWENQDTQAVMCIGDVINEKMSLKDIISNAIKVSTGRSEGPYEKGVAGLQAWKKAILNDSEFSTHSTESSLHEKLMCHDDAMCCVMDGRSNASKFFWERAEQSPYPLKMQELSCMYNQEFLVLRRMEELLLGWGHSKERLEKFMEKETRVKVGAMIDEVIDIEKKAVTKLAQLKEAMEVE